MKNIMRGALALSWLATVNPAWAQNGIDEQINSAIKPAADAVGCGRPLPAPHDRRSSPFRRLGRVEWPAGDRRRVGETRARAGRS